MLFTDWIFFVLLGITFVLYYMPVMQRYQVMVLIAASAVFYAYNQPALLILLLISASISAISSYKVFIAEKNIEAKIWATFGVVLNLVILCLFKYGALLILTFYGKPSSSNSVGEMLISLPLPLGISFYSFHGISLVVDVWRRKAVGITNVWDKEISAKNHGKKTLLYLMFFPQLIAGPIVKAHEFYPQINRKFFQDIDWERAIRALIVGYFLKCVIANNLQMQTFWLASPYYLGLSSLNLLFLLFGYSMQIFSDFAGYSLIAIGLAYLFGYRLPDNFRFPYISETFSEFWTRWHISLSTWLRTYLYYPLGGNRAGKGRTYINLLIVMGLGGLWHGAAWSYAVWGLWHGGALVIERFFSNSRFYRVQSILIRTLRIGLVFVVVTMGWILFKLPHFSDVLGFSHALIANRALPFGKSVPFFITIYSIPIIAYHALYLMRRGGVEGFFFRIFNAIRGESIILGGMTAAIILASGDSSAFIYFQF